MSGDELDQRMPVELEMVQEKAGALARVGEALERALGALATCEATLASAPPAERPALLARRSALRDEASERLWYLLVQRESVGLHNHDPVYQLYRVPPDVRLRAGPRRRGP